MPKPKTPEIQNDDFTVDQLKQITEAERVRTLVDHDPDSSKPRYQDGYAVMAGEKLTFVDENGQTHLVPFSRLKKPEAKVAPAPVK